MTRTYGQCGVRRTRNQHCTDRIVLSLARKRKNAALQFVFCFEARACDIDRVNMIYRASSLHARYMQKTQPRASVNSVSGPRAQLPYTDAATTVGV